MTADTRARTKQSHRTTGRDRSRRAAAQCRACVSRTTHTHTPSRYGGQRKLLRAAEEGGTVTDRGTRTHSYSLTRRAGMLTMHQIPPARAVPRHSQAVLRHRLVYL